LKTENFLKTLEDLYANNSLMSFELLSKKYKTPQT